MFSRHNMFKELSEERLRRKAGKLDLAYIIHNLENPSPYNAKDNTPYRSRPETIGIFYAAAALSVKKENSPSTIDKRIRTNEKYGIILQEIKKKFQLDCRFVLYRMLLVVEIHKAPINEMEEAGFKRIAESLERKDFSRYEHDTIEGLLAYRLKNVLKDGLAASYGLFRQIGASVKQGAEGYAEEKTKKKMLNYRIAPEYNAILQALLNEH